MRHFLIRAYSRLTLLQQFLTATAITILLSMTALAYWISERVETSLVQSAAEEVALLVDVLIRPNVQSLAISKNMSPEDTRQLDRIVSAPRGSPIKVLKVWLRDGTLVYSSSKESIGERFLSAELNVAFDGKVSSSVDLLEGPEHAFERTLRLPLIEVHAPLHLTDEREIIAVAEVYNDASRLLAAVRSVQLASAALIAAVTAPMMTVLFFIVQRANAKMRRERLTLNQKYREIRSIASQNEKLRKEAENARIDSIKSNERLLGQIGQDLHDGPVQLVSILMLKQSELLDHAVAAKSQYSERSIANLTTVTRNLQKELSDIAAGLVLPEIEDLSVIETLHLAIQQHENTTATEVIKDIDDLPPNLSTVLKICLFRFVQEGLNNAYRHAQGNGQYVSASVLPKAIILVVRDNGPAAREAAATPHKRVGLGIAGLHRRISALGGYFAIRTRAQGGTELIAKLPIETNLPDF